MRWLRRLLAQNSIILTYDHVSDDSCDELKEQIEEISQYYQFVYLSQLSRPTSKYRAMGVASLVFTSARRSLLLRALPLLQDRKIPFTVFLRPDCIGTNRLPFEEERKIFKAKNPDFFTGEEEIKVLESAWSSFSEAEARLREYRKALGPLPLNDLDPTTFYMTWGQIIQLPPALRELGLSLTQSPDPKTTLEDLNFVRQQTKSTINSAYSPRLLNSTDRLALKSLGVSTIVGTEEGIVVRNSDPLSLPQFKILKAEVES